MAGIFWNQPQPFGVPASCRSARRPWQPPHLDDIQAGMPQPNKHEAWDRFGQSFVILDPFLQDGQENVPDDCDLFTSGHAGMGSSRLKKGTATDYNYLIDYVIIFLSII
jgi:hypothetical protein